MSFIKEVSFFTTVNDLRNLPNAVCEIAFAGRSNAGKSSALNALVNRRRLAFVSKTPGRTQHINYFSLGNNRYLVDLPGYGYARVPEDVKRHWETLIGTYLQTRGCLLGLVLIMDIRHPLTTLDRRMLEWFSPTQKPVHILLTKADKLTRGQAAQTLRSVRAQLSARFPWCTAQLFSSVTRIGLAEADAAIEAWFSTQEVAITT